jgi:hypothetical protein
MPLVEFIYNNSVYSTINISPFFAIYRFHSNIPFTIRDDRPKKEVFMTKEIID